MEWSTVLISGLVSAVISGFVGLVFVSRTTVAQIRAREREEARKQIVVIAKDLQRRLLTHRDSDNPHGRRHGAKIEMDDLSTAWPVGQAILQLGLFRRWWTMRLAQRIFGVWIMSRVPLMKDDSGESAFSAWVRDAMRHGDAPVITGSWHKALSAPSKSPEVTKALRDLRLLEHL